MALLGTAVATFGCSSVTNDAPNGMVGAGGTAGTGGAPDAGIAPLVCQQSATSCVNGQIDPIERSQECLLVDPPVLEDACDGTESHERPLSCALTGNPRTYRLTSLQIADDCNLGYDLDGCDGNTCLPGEDAGGEGMDGVDNALAGLASLAILLGTNLSEINQSLYDELCDDKTILHFEVDANRAEGCATVTTFVNNESEGTVRLQLSDAGCLSGEFGTIPLQIGGAVRALGNAVGRLTIADNGFANGVVGVTIDQITATTLATRLIGGIGSSLVVRLFDINADLSHDVLLACNALSVTLRVGGALVTPSEAPQ